MIQVNLFQRVLQTPMQSLVKDRVPNVRCAAIRCLKTLSERLKDPSIDEFFRKSLALLADDPDFEVKRMISEL